MTGEGWEQWLEQMRGMHRRLEQSQVEAEENHARWHVNFQRSLDALLEQQARASSEMAELREWGKELAKSQVRMQNSVADLGDSHKHSRNRTVKWLRHKRRRTRDWPSFLAALERRFGKDGHF